MSLKIALLYILLAIAGCSHLEQTQSLTPEKMHLTAFNKVLDDTCLKGEVYTETRLSSLVAVAGEANEEHWTSESMCLSIYDGASLIRVWCEDTECGTEDVRIEPVSGDEEMVRYDSEESI